jgi:hypothetical protein
MIAGDLEVPAEEAERRLLPWDGSLEWDNDHLHALDLPVQNLPVAELLWHLDEPFWRSESGNYVCPRDVLGHPGLWPEEDDRINHADLSYPPEVVLHNRRWFVLDGLHRLTRAVSEGRRSIAVRVLPPERLSEIAPRKKNPGSETV